MANQPTLEDKALALALLEWSNPQRWVSAGPTPEGWILDWYAETDEDDERLSVLEGMKNCSYRSCITALADAARRLGLEPDKQIMALETLRSRLSLSQKVDLYFDTVTREELLQHCKDAGMTIVPLAERRTEEGSE